jgi:hypothetical protein
MPKIAHSALDMISGMTPAPQTGDFVFITTDDSAVVARITPLAIASFKEAEGMSMIVTVEVAKEAGFEIGSPMRCITLNVYSSLDGVGLTAAVSAALGDASIPCNMVSAFHHDHVFVPSAMCDRAMEILTDLQNKAV